MSGGKTVLVTGGAGYVGSHTVVELLKQNYNVISIDNLVNAFAASPNEKPEAIKRVECLTGKTVTCYNIDIRNREKLDELFKKVKNRFKRFVIMSALVDTQPLVTIHGIDFQFYFSIKLTVLYILLLLSQLGSHVPSR